MVRTPKTSKWYATPQEARKRKVLHITLSDEARAKLERMVEAQGTTKSAVIEAMLLAAKL